MANEELSGSKLGITLVVMIAALMAMIDITIVNVALNDIRASFGTPIDQIGWVSTGYMMANIVIIPMTGWFQKRFGYKRLGFIFIPVSVLALSGLSPEQRGNATGLFNLTRELGGSFGTALMGMLVSDGIKIHSSYLAESITPYNPLVQLQMQQLGAGVGSQTYQSELVAESLLHAKVTTQAMVLSFESGFRWVALAMSLGLVLVLLLKKPTSGVAPVGAH